MKRTAPPLVSMLILGLLGPVLSFAEDPADSPSAPLARAIEARLKAFHQGEPANGETLQLVYFHPADTRPQADFRDRITRIMGDIRDFYRDEMRRLGFRQVRELPLEMDPEEAGRVRIHLVKGADKSTAYTYENRIKVRRELEAALDGVIDFDRDFVLVFGGMCRKRGENDYFFHAPYYGEGGSDQRWGVCYVADCELLDPANLKNTEEQMTFQEHYYERREMSVANFNSMYLGGTAHELGHGLSLPHNGEWSAERVLRGKALMGGGNHTYRNDLWGGGKGSFLTLPSAIRLNAHPLFTQSDRDRFKPTRGASVRYLDFSESGDGALAIAGEIASGTEAIAVIAYTDPLKKSGADYDAKPWAAEVRNGRFTLVAAKHEPGPHELRLTFVLANGATFTKALPYSVNKASRVDLDDLTSAWLSRRAEELVLAGNTGAARRLAQDALDRHGPTAHAPRLRHLLALDQAPAPRKLDEIKDDTAFLSAVAWKKAQVAYGAPARDHFFHDANNRDAVFLVLGDEFHPRGLYAHAPSRFEFDLAGRWKRFTAVVGQQKDAGNHTHSRFLVKGDGVELFRSSLLQGDQVERIDLDVTDVTSLELIAEPGPNGQGRCWSVWGSPQVAR